MQVMSQRPRGRGRPQKFEHKLSRQVFTRLTAREVIQLAALARARKITVSDLVRDAIKAVLDQSGQSRV